MKIFICAILLASCLITGITLLSIWGASADPSYSDANMKGQITALA